MNTNEGLEMKSRTLLLAAAFVAFTLPATAQEWPNRTITLVVPFAPGGGIDASARLQALVLGEILGQTIVVENVGAAAGTVGSARVAKSAPDGYTFLVGNSGTHSYSQSLYKKKPYDSLNDFETVGMVTDSPRLLVARKGLPVNNLKELVAHMKANQDKMQYSSAGVGSGTHLPCALLNFTLGVNITMVPYRGEGPALQDVIADRIDYMCTTIQSGAVQAKQNTVKGIAVMAPRRASIVPDIATTRERAPPASRRRYGTASSFPRARRRRSWQRPTRRSRRRWRGRTSAKRWRRSASKSCRRTSGRRPIWRNTSSRTSSAGARSSRPPASAWIEVRRHGVMSCARQ